jgi:hypothetical protein
MRGDDARVCAIKDTKAKPRFVHNHKLMEMVHPEALN